MNDADPAAPSEQPTPPAGGEQAHTQTQTQTQTQTPPPPQAQATGPQVTRDEVKDLGRLRRSVTDRHIAGVAGGIARHLDVDAIIVRVALVVSVFFGGAGFLLYVGAWILVPEEGTDDEPLGLDRRSRSVALAGLGVLALLAAVGDWAGAFWFPWPVAVVAAIAVWFLHRKEKSPGRQRTGYGYPEPTFTGAPTEPATSYAETSYPDASYPEGTVSTSTYAYEPVGDPQWQQYSRPSRRPRNPRKRGPKLFLFTVALIALSEGVLGVVDLAGVRVVDSAYPALALGITAAMLILGAFWGRAGGLIALGLVAALATAATTAGNRFDQEDRSFAPTSAGDVRDQYDFGGGRFTLDLSGIDDVDALDGRDIAIDGVGGRVEVIVPDGMDVEVRTQVVGGESRVFDRRSEGFDITQNGFLDGGGTDMSINIDLVAGEIIVREAA
ncbi:PspC domain-containing protein [Nocardioides KLBMP 9356]|uniref:PspC domain-containing protein n=1 Tax=Nocardioides potassii TaxID=2911371 RepID=A0ABS9HE83_9ACTN|nr:PspC domain-containing protein [Nocardioides potassii]MCF6378819.1 PspC domain-containing protein [Nocardioides potassii]